VSPAVFLGEFNEILWKALGGRILMTFFLALVDQERGLVTIANAGHPFPLVIPKDPADERLRRAHSTRRHFTLKQPGNPLGCGSGVTYQESQIALRPGDRLVFYTDGLTEGMSPEGEQWGKRRLEAALSAASQEGPAELVTSILRLAAAHFGRQPLADDVTFVVAEVAAPSA
jgi:sigma-B regulation protein RsbU (phosphoserine phosphatase)